MAILNGYTGEVEIHACEWIYQRCVFTRALSAFFQKGPQDSSFITVLRLELYNPWKYYILAATLLARDKAEKRDH